MEAQCPERAVDPDSEDFCRPEQEQALLSIPATPQKKKNFSPETIAAAVSECVDKKMSVAVVATKYEVCYSTIRKWVKRSGKTLPSRHATTPKKPDNPTILNFFSPTKNPTRHLSLPPPEARDNAMDVSDFLQVKVEEDEIEIVEEMTTVDNSVRDCTTAECLETLKQVFKRGMKRKLVAGRKRNVNHETTMLFMESGRKQSPWYTWQVTAGEDNSGKYDMQKKAKKGDKTEEATFVMKCLKRRTTPAKCSWSAACCLCGRKDVHPTRLNIKRKSSYISDPQDEGPPVSSNKLGRMSSMVWNSETVTAHYYCLFYAADKDMIQSPYGDNIDTQLEGFPIEVVLDQVEKSEKDSCVFCRGSGACSQCANLRCISHGWYHFPCGLKNGCVQKDGKSWCGRCSGGQVPAGGRPSVGSTSKGGKRRGRGMQKRQILPASVESSQSSQELFSNPRSYPAATSSGLGGDQLGLRDLSRDGVSDGCLLQPISGQQILAEIDRRKEERSKVLENPLTCVNIAQVHQIPKEEFMAEDGLPVKVEATQAVERYSIFHKLPEEEDTDDPQPGCTTNKALEQVVLFNNCENTLPSPSGEQPPRPESRSLLEDDDDLETEPFDNSFSESPGENQSDPKISLRAANDSIIVVEDEVERDLPPKRSESSSGNELETMRRQMELTEALLKMKRAELEQLEIKRKEEVNFFEKKLQMKDCEMALLKERNNTEMAKKEEEWKTEKKKDEDQILKLRSELEEAKKEKEEAKKERDEAKKEKDEAKKEKDKVKKEKDEATRKLDAFYQLARSQQGVKPEGEYVERFSSQDVGISSGVKREAEEDESQEGDEKRARLSCWNL